MYIKAWVSLMVNLSNTQIPQSVLTNRFVVPHQTSFFVLRIHRARLNTLVRGEKKEALHSQRLCILGLVECLQRKKTHRSWMMRVNSAKNFFLHSFGLPSGMKPPFPWRFFQIISALTCTDKKNMQGEEWRQWKAKICIAHLSSLSIIRIQFTQRMFWVTTALVRVAPTCLIFSKMAALSSSKPLKKVRRV